MARPENLPPEKPSTDLHGRFLFLTCSLHGSTSFKQFGFAVIVLECGCQWASTGRGLVPTEYLNTHGSWSHPRIEGTHEYDQKKWEWNWTNGHSKDIADERLR